MLLMISGAFHGDTEIRNFPNVEQMFHYHKQPHVLDSAKYCELSGQKRHDVDKNDIITLEG